MDREINLLEYVPDILSGIREYKEIGKAENPELNMLWQELENTFLDQFVDIATEYGVKRWESILTVLPKGTDTLDERKFRILTRLNEQLPYSWKMLMQQLESLCGQKGYTAELESDKYTMKVRVALTAKANFDDVGGLLRRAAPANIVIDLDLLYNQHKTLAQFTHVQLARYRQKELRDEVIK